MHRFLNNRRLLGYKYQTRQWHTVSQNKMSPKWGHFLKVLLKCHNQIVTKPSYENCKGILSCNSGEAFSLNSKLIQSWKKAQNVRTRTFWGIWDVLKSAWFSTKKIATKVRDLRPILNSNPWSTIFNHNPNRQPQSSILNFRR